MTRITTVNPATGQPMQSFALQDDAEIDAALSAAAGEIPDGPGAYYPPTVLDHVAPGMTAFVEDTFGPVAAIVRARDPDHAVDLANDSDYGPGAALWTADIEAPASSRGGSRRGRSSSTA